MLATWMNSGKSRTVYKYRIVIYYIITSLAVFLLVAYAIYFVINDLLYNSIAEKSVDLAFIIARNNAVKKSIYEQQYAALQQIMVENYSLTDASYIAISNPQNIRIYHTSHDFINKKVPDAPDSLFLASGHYYTQTKTGASGVSVSTRVPIFWNGQYLGFVSVGYLEGKRLYSVYKYFTALSLLLFAVMATILVGSIFSWRLLIKQLSGMPPEVINYRYQIRRAILNAICDGIIAVDISGKVLAINHSAMKLLSCTRQLNNIIGHAISEFVTPDDAFVGLHHSEYYEQDISFNGAVYVATRTVILNEEGAIAGFVIYFKEKKSDSFLESQMRHIRFQSEELRVMSHEYKNKMAVISGLIEIGEYDYVKKYIFKENYQQKFYDHIIHAFHSASIVGLILGKVSKAKECGIDIIIDSMSHYDSRSYPINDDEMACIIGNLIDNAIEATIATRHDKQNIFLYLNDQGDEIVLSVEDAGHGVDKEIMQTMFELGITSKNELNHGIGLYLVRSILIRVNGTCIVESAENNCGTIFSVYIPVGDMPTHCHREDEIKNEEYN